MLHNRYLVAGGEDQSTSAEVALLRETGCSVELLEHDNREVQRLGRASVAFRTIWSRDSFRQVFQRLHSGNYDVLHVQNFFPLWSPSVYHAAARAGVPVVQTLRNYRLMCVNSLLFRDGHPCEDCVGGNVPWSGILHGCYHDSRVGSAVVAAMIGVHRAIRTWQTKIDAYIALTPFARDKFIEGGFPGEKIMLKPNFVHPAPAIGHGGGGYALFAGRLSSEKGIGTLLDAWSASGCVLPLKIVGDGPETDRVIASAARDSRIEYVGWRSPSDLIELLRSAEFLVFPSECYENMPRTIIEAFAVGTPVLASKIGAGITMVEPDKTGFHFNPGDAGDLRRLSEWCSGNLDAVRKLRPNARTEFELKYSGPANAQALLDIYRRARNQSAAGSAFMEKSQA